MGWLINMAAARKKRALQRVIDEVKERAVFEAAARGADLVQTQIERALEPELLEGELISEVQVLWFDDGGRAKIWAERSLGGYVCVKAAIAKSPGMRWEQ